MRMSANASSCQELCLMTPANSQEEADGILEEDIIPCETITAVTSPSADKMCEVVWLDTDESEDEDYLPQNRHSYIPSPPRRNLANCSETQDKKRAKLGCYSGDDEPLFVVRQRDEAETIATTSELVRRAVDQAVDNGADYVDLSHQNLTELPDEIAELRYVTILRKDRIKNASLKLFLYGNMLTRLSPSLFKLQNLAVLSLRNNRLTVLPPEIGLLKHLTELSVGNNLLRYVPAELLSLPRLCIVSLCPNPFLSLPRSSPRLLRFACTIPSLAEIAYRQILAANGKFPEEEHKSLPYTVRHRIESTSSVNACHTCRSMFYAASVEELHWQDVFGSHNIPVLYRYCSPKCCNAHFD